MWKHEEQDFGNEHQTISSKTMDGTLSILIHPNTAKFRHAQMSYVVLYHATVFVNLSFSFSFPIVTLINYKETLTSSVCDICYKIKTFISANP